jgi:hypothetical protein
MQQTRFDLDLDLDLDLDSEPGRGAAAMEPDSSDCRLDARGLARLGTLHCPVTRQPLGGSEALAPVPMRLCEERPFTTENLVIVSRTAAQARAGLTAAQILQRAERMQREDAPPQAGLDAAAWARLASLCSFALELPHAQAVRVPLRVLPPPELRLCNPVQALQAALTQILRLPGWSRRAAAIADQLPRPELRHDFNLFVGALAARLMEIPLDADARESDWAMADAWADARVQRRWAQFAIQLDGPACRALLARVQRGSARPMLPRRHERMAGVAPGRAAPRKRPQRAAGASTSMRPQTSRATSQRLATVPIANSSLPSHC